MLEEKKKMYKEKIDFIAKSSFNDEQKIISKEIIDLATKDNIDAIYQLISQRVKTGFVFDAAPEVNHNAIVLAEEDEDMYITNDSIVDNEHKLIIGDNYDALKNLLITHVDHVTGEGLIDIIYIDPPYGTEKAKTDGNDYKEEIEASKFIYRDKYTRDGWLNLMNERLKLAKKLIRNDGLIFISIDDNNQAYLKILMDEIFGEENFISNIIWQKKKGGGQAKYIYEGHEYILCYSKNKFEISGLTTPNKDVPKNKIKKIDNIKYYINDDIIRVVHGKYEKGTERRCHYEDLLEIKGETTKNEVDIKLKNGEYILVKSQTNKSKNYVARLEPLSKKRKIIYSIYNECRTEHGNEELNEKIFNQVVFPNPKPTQLLKYLLNLNDKEDSIILDFFAGSGSTLQAIMELNEEDGGSRKGILVTNNENNIAENITWERIYRVIKGKGSNNEKIDWEYKPNIKFLNNNSLRVFKTVKYELKINELDKANILRDKAIKQFKLLNPNNSFTKNFDIYYELSCLTPFEEDKK